jgi:hypothetical protein
MTLIANTEVKGFLMNVPLTAVKQNKIGTCPHGLPLGACPICNGMGSGGGASKKVDPHAGEMSWDECYAVWQKMLKAKDLAMEKKEQAMLAQMQPQVSFAGKVANFADKLSLFSQKLADFAQKPNSNLPLLKIIAKPLAKALSFAMQVALPVLNAMKNVAQFVQKTFEGIQQKLADISDKLSALFGELKNSNEKKISEKLKNFGKKFKSLFFDETEEINDEELKVQEEKRLYEQKTELNEISRKGGREKKMQRGKEAKRHRSKVKNCEAIGQTVPDKIKRLQAKQMRADFGKSEARPGEGNRNFPSRR